MIADPTELWRAIEQADALPPGPARIARLDEQAARADALLRAAGGTLGHRADRADLADLAAAGLAARVSLVPACLEGGQHLRVAGLIAWLLARYDGTDPDSPAAGAIGAIGLDDSRRQGVLVSVSRAVTGLLKHPDVPLGQLEALTGSMADRYQAAGQSPAPVLRARFLLARHLHGAAGSQAAFDAWRVSSKRFSTGIGECAGCELTEQVRQLADLGRHEDAVAAALPVLDGGSSGGSAGRPDCADQPVAVIGAALESLLRTSRAERAAAEHVRAVRLLRARAGQQAEDRSGRADHLLACARAGRLERGLDLLEEWLPAGLRAGSPATRLALLAAAARLLRGLAEAGHGGRPLVLRASGQAATSDPAAGHELDGPTGTVAELGARLTREARELGARFDARNGTGTVGGELERVLDTPPLPDLPLDPLARSPRAARIVPAATGPRRGRRAAGRQAAAALDGAEPEVLARAFDAALAADSQPRQAAVLDAWRAARAAPVPLGQERPAARLDAWLGIEELVQGGDGLPAGSRMPAGLAAALHGAQRLTETGLRVEGLLHEQACLLAAARNTAAAGHRPADGAASPFDPAARRVERIAIDLGADPAAGPANAGLALSRLALIREVAAAAGDPAGTAPDPDPAQGAAWDPVAAGLAALASVPEQDLDHQHRRAVCRLLRLRAADEPPDEAVESLFGAVESLPDGVRPLERALAGADLAGALQGADPAAALAAWDRAVADASDAGASSVLGNLLAASATLRHSLGDPVGAAEDLARAVPLLDRHAAPALAAQARFDLARAQLDLGRPFLAAEIAEAALADLTELVGAAGGAELHLAGGCAFTAAEANDAGGDPDRARAMALRSAQCHAVNGNPIAEAEAWQLAARFGGPADRIAADLARATALAEAGGDWARAATCRRERVTALREAAGVPAAIAALDEAEAALTARQDSPAGRHAPEHARLLAARQLRWHRLAVAEQRGRLLAVSGRFAEAMAQVDGLEAQYRELGDDWSARDLLGLHGQLRAELDDLDGALADLRRAAEEAERAGDADQAHGLGERLAGVLDRAGRPGQAEAAWQRFSKP